MKRKEAKVHPFILFSLLLPSALVFGALFPDFLSVRTPSHSIIHVKSMGSAFIPIAFSSKLNPFQNSSHD